MNSNKNQYIAPHGDTLEMDQPKMFSVKTFTVKTTNMANGELVQAIDAEIAAELFAENNDSLFVPADNGDAELSVTVIAPDGQAANYIVLRRVEYYAWSN